MVHRYLPLQLGTLLIWGKWLNSIITDISSEGQIGHSSIRRQDMDFNIPVGPITRARAKRLKESFRNLVNLFVEEMHQEWVKEEKKNKAK